MLSASYVQKNVITKIFKNKNADLSVSIFVLLIIRTNYAALIVVHIRG